VPCRRLDEIMPDLPSLVQSTSTVERERLMWKKWLTHWCVTGLFGLWKPKGAKSKSGPTNGERQKARSIINDHDEGGIQLSVDSNPLCFVWSGLATGCYEWTNPGNWISPTTESPQPSDEVKFEVEAR
jgi:hypothetical protein